MCIKTFLNNLRYLFRYNLKEMYLNANTSIDVNQFYTFSQKLKAEIKNEWDSIFVPKIKNPMQTLEELLTSNKSIIRFGDGEFMLIEGKDIPFQLYNADLAEKLKYIFKINDPNLLIGGPFVYFSDTTNIRNAARSFLYFGGGEIYSKIQKYCNPDTTYYSTEISQVFPIYKNYEFEKHYNLLKQILKNKKITIITGDWIKNKIDYNILEECSALSVNYIYAPSINAYFEYDSLKQQISRIDKDNVLIFAIGPAGKVIAYDMYVQGYRVLDLGHAIKDYDSYMKQEKMDANGIYKYFSPDA